MQDELLSRFVASFEKLDDMVVFEHLSPIAKQLAVGPGELGMTKWRPAKTPTDPQLLESIYAVLPSRYPPLYERLVLTYRWDVVDLELLRLSPNPPGDDLSALQPNKNDFLTNFLLNAGYIRFGLGPDVDFDPICFELKSRKKNREFRIVKIDHEDILCRERPTSFQKSLQPSET